MKDIRQILAKTNYREQKNNGKKMNTNNWLYWERRISSTLQYPSNWTKNQIDMSETNKGKSNLIM